MEYDGNDYFGHKTEDEFRDWAVVQFNEHTDVTVIDNSEMAYRFKLVGQDGCCERCYSEVVSAEIEYKGTVIVFHGTYLYDGEYDTFMTLDYCRFMKSFQSE